MSPEISIIIPAYNAARTIEATVRNVLASTIPVHVYVVDDGSTDETLSILKRIEAEVKVKGVGAERNGSSLTVIHQENAGAYQARLNALKQIKTPYFGFVDADDTVEPDMFERMVAACEANELDAVQCRVYSRVEHVENVVTGGAPPDPEKTADLPISMAKIITGPELEAHKFRYLVNPREACYIWDKVYRNQYDFDAFEPTDRITNFDDMVFNFQFFPKIKRMGFLNEGLYHYATTDGSAVHAFGPRQRHDFLWMVKNHYRLCKSLFNSPASHSHFKLFLGHLDWLFINSRSAAISWIRSLVK